MNPRLPSEQEKRVIVDFLRDSTNVWVEGVHFERWTDGAMRMRCRYRDLKDATKHANLVNPSPKGETAFEELCVAMSDWLEHEKLDWLTDMKEPADGVSVQ
jgi:hypothetical protein